MTGADALTAVAAGICGADPCQDKCDICLRDAERALKAINLTWDQAAALMSGTHCLAEMPSPPCRRASDTFTKVCDLFEEKPEWSMIELANRGLKGKATYNAVNYLANCGRLSRVSRGYYRRTGLPLAASPASEKETP